MKTIVNLFLLQLALVPFQASAADYSKYIRGVSVAGSGCSATSIGSGGDERTTFDGHTLTVAVDAFQAEGRSNCQVLVDLKLPHGWTWGLKSFSTLVSYKAQNDVVAKAIAYVQGDANERTVTTNYSGSGTQEFKADYSDSVLWSPCAARISQK